MDTTRESPGPVADQEIDACGLKCPLPILRTKKALARMDTGQLLAVLTTDPHAEQDFQAFCRQTGNALVQQQRRDAGVMMHIIRRR